MKKIVFFDIDGTLLDHHKKLPASTKEAIRLLKEKGIYVAIATGRAPFMFEGIREELDIHSYVSFNGQYVVFEDEVIYRNPLKTEALNLLLERADGNGVPLIFMNEATMRSSVPYSDHIAETLGTFSLGHPEKDEYFFRENDIYQTLLYVPEQEMEGYEGISHELRYVRWHPVCVDVLPEGGSKAAGIELFIKKAGFCIQDVYAFGDGLNDIEMLQTVGTGIAMGNAEQALLQHADIVTTDVENDGIWNGLKKIGLI
ncbi:Cof-type HAD-IIB family hydrolase [Bacillus testis]|uniref:Cof-type HAD-IIB family hydrolase n=1 Tax=Bacillus testis TaxID=1622072 RepID=UPI00067E6AA4|nr:Cof-type HAD-IIB family hydrolase [Bacillus testis]